RRPALLLVVEAGEELVGGRGDRLAGRVAVARHQGDAGQAGRDDEANEESSERHARGASGCGVSEANVRNFIARPGTGQEAGGEIRMDISAGDGARRRGGGRRPLRRGRAVVEGVLAVADADL